MEAALAQLKRAGTLVLVGAGIARPKFDNNRILLNELMITGAFVYDADGFERALELLASGELPSDLLVEPDDCPARRAARRGLGLHEARSRQGDDRSDGNREATSMTATEAKVDRADGSARRKPRFNHVAMSLPADLLDEEHRSCAPTSTATCSGSTSSR